MRFPPVQAWQSQVRHFGALPASDAAPSGKFRQLGFDASSLTAPFRILRSRNALYPFLLCTAESTLIARRQQKQAGVKRAHDDVVKSSSLQLAVRGESGKGQLSAEGLFGDNAPLAKARRAYREPTTPRMTLVVTRARARARAVSCEARVRSARPVCLAHTMRGQLNGVPGDSSAVCPTVAR